MYLKRFPRIQEQFRSDAEKTEKLEIVWTLPEPVPERRKAHMRDHFFTIGRFEGDVSAWRYPCIALFVENPSRGQNLEHADGFMLVRSPLGLMRDSKDFVTIFHAHRQEDDMGWIAVEWDEEKQIRVIKGVYSDEPRRKLEAKALTVLVNREITRLFRLAEEYAEAYFRLRTELGIVF